MASVLFVDDDVSGCEPAQRYLQKLGHQVTCLPNGRDALAYLTNNQPPDVIVLDLRMPYMDGMSLLEVLRLYLRWRLLPVFVISGSVDDVQGKRMQELGVRKVFIKGSYQLTKLAEAIDEAVKQGESDQMPIDDLSE